MLTHPYPARRANPGDPALQPIGNLTRRVINSPETLVSTTAKSPQTLPISSPTGQGQNPHQTTPAKPIGSGLTATTSAITPTKSLPAALAADNPNITDRALEACLPPSVKTSKREIWEDKSTPEWGWDGELTRIEWAQDLPETDRQRALQTVQQSLMPMTGAECQKALAKLRLMTKVRNESTEDIRLTLMFYEEELRNYPADVVRHVLSTQKNLSPWWPAWSELKERLDLYSARRRRLLEALKNGKTSQPSSINGTSSTTPPVDPALMAEARRLLAERDARKREAESLQEPTPEEMEKRRQELIQQCEASA